VTVLNGLLSVVTGRVEQRDDAHHFPLGGSLAHAVALRVAAVQACVGRTGAAHGSDKAQLPNATQQGKTASPQRSTMQKDIQVYLHYRHA
jgi:hypothetical protein